MRYTLLFLLLLLQACANTAVEKPTSDTVHLAEAEQEESPRYKRVYYFQHKLIASWVFESEGAFFFDIYNGEVAQLLKAATEIVDQEFADGLDIFPVYGKDAVVIGFPEPEFPANCFFSLIRKVGESYAYYTYEKTMDWGDAEIAGVLGGWNEEGGHMNFGARAYTSREEFIKDILSQ